jgi:putative nucleotidyltransferase with HDIG domain
MTPPTDLEARQRKTLQTLLDAGARIPSRPALLDEIEQRLEQPDINLGVVAALIKKDPALTGALFAIANSAAFGLGLQVRTVEDALMALGQTRALNIIKGELLHRALGSHAPWFQRFWERAAGIAQMSAALSSRCGVDFDQAYLAGLFHDCGVALMIGAFADYCGTDCDMNLEPHWLRLTDRDRIAGLDHAVAGYLVARAWKLPPEVADAVLHHHSPMLPGGEETKLVALLQLAMHLYNRLFAGGDSPEWPDAKPWVLRTLHFDETRLDGYA